MQSTERSASSSGPETDPTHGSGLGNTALESATHRVRSPGEAGRRVHGRD